MGRALPGGLKQAKEIVSLSEPVRLTQGRAPRPVVAMPRAKGFSDMHVIRRGNMKNAVSLGVYSRKAHLERRVATLRDAGFPAEVKERYRTRRASWFDVVLPADNPLSGTDLAADYPDVEVRVRPCGDPST